MISLEGVTRVYGGLRAVDGVDLRLEPGARHGLIGPNGAGKSTLFKLILGAERVTSGVVRFDGRDITGMPEHQRVRLGIAQTFQHSSLFAALTCRENVLLALQRRTGDARRLFGGRRRALMNEASALLARVGLSGSELRPAASLSHGEQRQLEVALALALRPRLLLLDEPAAGMSPAETERLATIIEQLEPELAVLIVEHDLDFVFRVAREVSVLHLGSLLTTGSAEDVRASEEVARVYLGGASVDDVFIDEEVAS
ncbi:MAG TPA: ABC transporter ATP-binding protein [Solirubrobacter sp.]|nr:ABC transporter ATP-binding protein [Solirubrobacter sp.]